MPFILEYLFKFSVSLGVLYVFYRFLLRPLTFYQWNRFYLGCYTLLSFVIPFINITPWISENELENSRLLQAIPTLGNSNFIFRDDQVNWWTAIVQEKWKFIIIVFAAGSLLMFLKILYQYLSFQMIKRKAKLIETSLVKVYDVDSNISPFSFANSIFINRKLHTAEELQKVMQHEFVHVKQKHTADILLGEVLVTINWFNPFAWLMRQAIRQNLEFIADDNVLQTGLDAREYQYLLLKVIGIPQYGITNNFNFSSIKKRIIMMNKIKTAKVHLVKFLFIIPLLALMLVAFRQKNKMLRTNEMIRNYPMLSNLIGDTVPKTPPPPPSPEISAIKPSMPAQPSKSKQLPGNVSSITITEFNATVKLKNGRKETYDLSKPKERAGFEKKYGQLLPPVPPAPVVEVEPAEEPEQAEKSVPAVKPAPPAIPAKPMMQVSPVKPVKVSVNSKVAGLEPLCILDGEPLPEGTDISTINASTIESIEVVKGAQAVSLYGKKALNGVVIITSKPIYIKTKTGKAEVISAKASAVKIDKISDYPGLVIIDGKESTKEALSKIDPVNISQVDVLTGDSAISQYKEKGGKGVMIITTK